MKTEEKFPVRVPTLPTVPTNRKKTMLIFLIHNLLCMISKM
jgi:hypothetical protein